MSKSSTDDNSIEAAVELWLKLCEEALEFSKAGKFQEAIEKYNETFTIKYNETFTIGETAAVYVGIGNELNHLGRYNEALVAFNDAIKLEPMMRLLIMVWVIR